MLLAALPSFLVRFGSAGLSFALFAAAARAFSVAEFGLFSIAMSVGMGAALLTTLGQNTILFKHFDGEAPPEARAPVIKAAALATLGGAAASLVVGAVVVGLGLWTGAPFWTAVGAGLMLAGPYTVAETLQGYWRARQKLFIAMLPREVVWRAAAIAVIAAFGRELGYLGVTALIGLVLLITVIPQLVAFLREQQGFWRAEPQFNRREVAHVLLVHFSEGVLYYGDILILGALAAAEEVAIYAAAARIAQVIALVQGAIDLKALPQMGLLIQRNDPAGAQNVAVRSARLSGALCALGALAVFAAAPLIVWVFGPAYAAAMPLIGALLLLQVLLALAGQPASVLMFAGQERFVAWFNLAVCAVFVGAGVLGVLFAGVWGLVAARVVVFGVAAFVRAREARRRAKVATAAYEPLRPETATSAAQCERREIDEPADQPPAQDARRHDHG